MIEGRNPAIEWSRTLFDGLIQAGVRHLCVCPGGRCAPLVFAAAERDELEKSVHIDERSAGFFALGLARQTRRPVAISCTSGSALANLYPAVVEAAYAGIPLILLTADRPPELVDCGAGQAIDQTRFFGTFVRHFQDLGVPELREKSLRWLHRSALRAAHESQGMNAGPVHLNLPFRKPLEPGAADQYGAWASPFECSSRTHARPAVSEVAGLVEARRSSARGVILCGVADLSADEVAGLSAVQERLGVPVLVEGVGSARWSSQLRGKVGAYDAILGSPALREALRPDWILRVGAMPVAKPALQWLEEQPPDKLFALESPHRWREPTARPCEFIEGDLPSLAEALGSHLDLSSNDASSWLERWLSLEKAAWSWLENASLPDEGALFPALMGAMAEGDSLHVASSMPVRDLSTFARPNESGLRVTCNRGTNGIDGTFATLFGGAWALRDSEKHAWLVIGDVACVHDLGALAEARHPGMNATLVVVNNDGGGIFAYLPLGSFGEVSERYFHTPHGFEFEHAAKHFGIAYRKTNKVDELSDALIASRQQGGVHLIEYTTKRSDNVGAQRALKHGWATHLLKELRRS